MMISNSHSFEARAQDAYFSPPEAVHALMAIERLPHTILEPSAGDGAIVKPLRAAGHTVIARDIIDYGEGYEIQDYLTAPALEGIDGIVGNPPYRMALEFAEKAVLEAPYVAFLLRLNWLESIRRIEFFRKTPPARIHVSSRRLPMMHRYGWEGPTAPSNTCFSWFIWDRTAENGPKIEWFDWADTARKPAE